MFVEPHSTVLLSHASIAFLLYTDPGSGILVWQLLLAAFFGAMFYLRKVKDLIVRRRHRPRAE